MTRDNSIHGDNRGIGTRSTPLAEGRQPHSLAKRSAGTCAHEHTTGSDRTVVLGDLRVNPITHPKTYPKPQPRRPQQPQQTPLTLTQTIKIDGTIYAHDFCRICGIKPNTLRMSRQRGKGPPAQRISNNRVTISLKDAAAWLQKTGRYSAAIMLAEWLEQRWREAAQKHRRADIDFEIPVIRVLFDDV